MEERFGREEEDVLLVDDLLGQQAGPEETVECFRCGRSDRSEPRRYDDLAVITSAGGQARAIQLQEAEAMRTVAAGQRPILRLDPDRVSELSAPGSERLISALSARYLSVWKRDRRLPVTAQEALEPVGSNGYDIWLTGGTVRDAVRAELEEGADAVAGDLDFVGSVPPGTFCERLREVVGRAEVPKRFNPFSGVVAVWTDARRQERFLEYATLRESSLTADGNHRFGCDLETDAQWRDLTINTLSFDWRNEYLLDPTGTGLEDARALRLRPAGRVKKKTGFFTEKLFRYLKFLDRWPDAKTDELRSFLCSHFDEIVEDMEMSDLVDIERWAQPLGDEPKKRRARALELLIEVAPGQDWLDLLNREWGGPK